MNSHNIFLKWQGMGPRFHSLHSGYAFIRVLRLGKERFGFPVSGFPFPVQGSAFWVLLLFSVQALDNQPGTLNPGLLHSAGSKHKNMNPKP